MNKSSWDIRSHIHSSSEVKIYHTENENLKNEIKNKEEELKNKDKIILKIEEELKKKDKIKKFVIRYYKLDKISFKLFQSHF